VQKYIFILGRSYELCRVELEAVFKALGADYRVEYFSGQILVITSQGIDYKVVGKKLAGIVKIAKISGESELNLEKLEKGLGDLLIGDQKERIEFGLSFFNYKISLSDFRHLIFSIKKALKDNGFSVRAVLPKNGFELSSVVVAKQKLKELIIAKVDSKFIIGETVWVQDFELWNKKDYGRPISVIKAGMLPPKVARMMVNLRLLGGMKSDNKIMLDPFCGVGTILAEGLASGLTVIGSDNLPSQVENTRRNLDWFKKEFKIDSDYKLVACEAENISNKLSKPVDFIVTEPYLGPLELGEKKLDIKKINKIVDQLEDFYIKCFINWQKILVEGGVVVIALPSYDLSYLNRGEIRVKRVIDNREKLGYNLIAGPLVYSREKAVVRRNIYILKRI